MTDLHSTIHHMMIFVNMVVVKSRVEIVEFIVLAKD